MSYDISGRIGALYPLHKSGEEPEIPMYSYETPAWKLWNAIGETLHEAGWSDEKIFEWLRSKSTRYALDGSLGDAIEEIGRDYAEKQILEL